MICKNCGAQLSDNSVFCGNCGSAVTKDDSPAGSSMPNPPMQGGFNPGMSAPAPQQPGFNPNMPPQGGQPGFDPNMPPQGGQPGFNPNMPLKKKIDPKLIAIPAGAVVIVIAIVLVIVKVVSGGAEKTLDRFLNGLFEEDGEAMYAELSTGYKTVLIKWAEAADMDGEITKEAEKDDMTLEEYINKTMIEEFEEVGKSFAKSAEYETGRNPEFSYEITAEEHASDEQLEKFNKITAIISDSFKVDDLLLFDVTLKAEGSKDDWEKNVTIFLCKESEGWKIIKIANDGTDFDDILDMFKAYSAKGSSSLGDLFGGI